MNDKPLNCVGIDQTKQPLVEVVAVAMWNTWNRVMVEYGLHKQSNGDFYAPEPTDDPIKAEAHRLLRKAALEEAQAAIEACHVGELATALAANDAIIRDIRYRDLRWHGDELVRQLLDRNYKLLTKLVGEP